MMAPVPEDLIGMAAGAVARVVDNPAGSTIEPVVLAAHVIANDSDRVMSSWVLVSEHADRATLWRSPDEAEIATVGTDGSIAIDRYWKAVT